MSSESPSLNYSQVFELGQSELGITTAVDPRPILVTQGLATCVGVAGFNAENQVGFLVHYQSTNVIPLAIGGLAARLRRLTGEVDFTIRMKGGLRDVSEPLVEQLQHNLFNSGDRNGIGFTFDGNQADLLHDQITEVVLGVDTSSGTFVEAYDHQQVQAASRQLPPGFLVLMEVPLPVYPPAGT